MTGGVANVSQDEYLVDLIEVLQAIDLDNPEAQLNAISITDSNGGRILL